MKTIVMLLLSLSLHANVFKQIKRNNPKLNNKYVSQLTVAIYSSARKYNLSPRLLAAIMGLESNYNLMAYNSKTDDLGLMQINRYNIKAYKFDAKRLMTDIQYSVDAGAKILSWFAKTYRKKEPNIWMSRYNVGTRKSAIHSKTAKHYLKLVRQRM